MRDYRRDGRTLVLFPFSFSGSMVVYGREALLHGRPDEVADEQGRSHRESKAASPPSPLERKRHALERGMPTPCPWTHPCITHASAVMRACDAHPYTPTQSFHGGGNRNRSLHTDPMGRLRRVV